MSEAGLNLEIYCITLVRGVEPREALHRLGVSDAAIQTATWPELTAQHPDDLPVGFLPGTAAAFVIGEYVVLVEDYGFRGFFPKWAGPVSRGTEAVNVYLDPDYRQELSIYRDGKKVAYIDGDEPEVIGGGDAEMAGRLIELTFKALRPRKKGNAPPEDLSDGRVDLLQVASGYLGLHPEVPDISGSVLGVAFVGYRPTDFIVSRG